MTTTSRLALDIPQSSENISAYPAEAAQSLGVLDGAVIITEGTLASRPGSSEYGNEYYATDTGQTFKYTGSAWKLVATGGGTVSTPSRTLNAAVQPTVATQANLILASIDGGGGVVELLIGATSSPSQEVSRFAAATGTQGTVVGWVPPGWFYRLQTTGGSPALVDGIVTEITF